MQFDIAAALVAISSMTSIFGAQLLFFWSRDRRSGWLGWYAAGFFCITPSILSYMIPVAGHEFLALGIGNALRIEAFVLLWTGCRVFGGRRAEYAVMLFVMCGWLGLCSTPFMLGNMLWRVIASSLVIALFCGLSAWELWRDRLVDPLPSRIPAFVIYSTFTLIVLGRVVLAAVLPFPIGALPASAVSLAVFGLVAVFHITFFGGFVVSMTRERRELEQHRRAVSDPLTGLLNRRAFLDEFAPGGEHPPLPAPVAVLVLDLDDFKSINDHFGHSTGDRVLRHFAEIAIGVTREVDRLYRMGGEEFCFVLPRTEPAQAMLIAERIRTRFAEAPISFAAQPVRATVSIGIATTGQPDFDLELLLAAGDAAVYEAKARGRNQTVVAGAPALRRAMPRREAIAAA